MAYFNKSTYREYKKPSTFIIALLVSWSSYVPLPQRTVDEETMLGGQICKSLSNVMRSLVN
jgi:hypothetical protein